MKNIKENNKHINISINIDKNTDNNININVNRNKNIEKNIKNAVLSKLSLNPKSIKDVINIINDNNFPTSENLYNELLKFDIHELLSIKANLEKADKVNFLVDEVKCLKWIPIDKDITEQTTNLIIIVLALASVLISLKETQKLEFLKYAIVYLGAFFILLVILMIVFKTVKNSYPSKKTNNKYKVFQYLVDIAIENKKKELN